MSSPLPDQHRQALTGRLRTALAQIAARQAPHVQRVWANLPAYNSSDVAHFTKQASAYTDAAKAAAVAHAAGFYALIAGIRPPSIGPKDVPVEPDLRGPFIQMWSTLTASGDQQTAIDAGNNRAEAMVTNLVASAARATGDLVYDRTDTVIVAWSRDPEPTACDWCLEAAQETYSSAEACDFGHDRCMCIAVPDL